MAYSTPLHRKCWKCRTWSYRVFQWIFCFSLFQYNCSQTLITENTILDLNRGIQVPFGRSVYLEPDKDLRFNVSPGDRCSVTVLQNDPLSQRPGALLPAEFPCQFDRREVQYTHFGSRVPFVDRVQLMIRYDSDTHTYIIPFTIFVKVTFVQLDIVTNNMPLKVNKLLDESDAVSRRNTAFTYDKDNQVCRVTVLAQMTGLPRYGHITNDTSSLSMINCDDFLDFGIRYQHSAVTNSPNRDYIPMVIEVLDRDNVVMKQEYFQKPVMIQGGLQNTRPQPSFKAFLVMEVNKGDSVDQFVMTAIPPKVLAAEDIETPAEQLIFNITGPLGPGEGVIVSTDDRNQPLKSFYQRDVQDLKIAYKPPADDSNILRSFSVEMQVVDAEGLTSQPFTLNIMVKPMNTRAPVATRNTGIQLFEGQSRQLLSSQNLEISDEDNLDKVKIFVIDGVRHGSLLLPPGRTYFTPADLDAGSVVYQHDGTDTYSDNIIFRMTDGKYEVEFLFPVTIFPIDDLPPVLNVNTGLEIYKNQLSEINRFILSATDIDSEDSKIRFILEPPYSKEGIILKRQFQVPDTVHKWQLIDGVYELTVDEFTQNDIINNKVFYKHIGPARTDVIFDRIRFRLADPTEPPNESTGHVFIVKVQPLDDQPPYLYPKTSLRLAVDEYQMTHFKRKFLRYTDDNTEDRQLRYTITRGPFDTDKNTPLGSGSIILCENPMSSVSSFTQAQIDHMKICYQPPSSELGITQRIIQFFFNVEDTNGNVLQNQQFTITLKPINNQPPVVTNKAVSVLENGQFEFTTRYLDIYDPDTDLTEISCIVTSTPAYGVLRKGQQPLFVGDLFKRKDLVDRNIVYVNTGQEMDKDQFSIDVTDGFHVVPVIVKINVRSVDDEPPTIVGMKPGVLSLELEVPESQSVVLPSKSLKATDPDSNDMTLTFIIEKYPRIGTVSRSGQRVDRFTQEDIIRKVVSYQHQGNEIGIQAKNDSFSLSLSDKSRNFMVGGNRVSQIQINVKILPVDNQPPRIILGAPFEVLESEKEAILPRHLDAMDDDTDEGNIQCTITVQPEFGYIENISPAPGSEKSRAGMPVTAFYIKDLRLGNINYVQSVHKGSEERSDNFKFRCTDGTNMSPQKKFVVAISEYNDETPEVFSREFIVMEGMELKIDAPILMAVDKDVPADELSFIITVAPRHGEILQQHGIAGTFPVTRFKKADIERSSTIMYKHDDTETTSDSFSFIVTDGKHNVSKTIPIMIIPVDDETPRLSINNGLEIEKVGEKKLITNDVLKAEDVDSPDPNITFILRRFPQHGYLIKSEGSNVVNLTVGMNFTQFDIDNRKIYYVHTGQEGKRDLIKFDVTDGLNPLIDRYFYVSVAGIDVIYPRVINRGVNLPEGGKVTLTTEILSGSDLNSPDESLEFTVTNAPQHGYLESTDNIGVPILTFKQIDLAGSKIRYVHDTKNEVKMDRFEFEVTDGHNTVSRTFRIAISDVDNKKPVVMFSTLRVKEGGNKMISPFELKAIDPDTPSNKIVFTITQIPVHGNILYNFSRTVHTFTYEDLEENRISYQHDGTETTNDGFSFTVTDGTHNDFYIFFDSSQPTKFPQTMPIEIVPVDNGVPQISINKGVTHLNQLPRGGLGIVITNKVLRVDDRDSPVDSLTYMLTKTPDNGYIINLDKGNISIITWTQGDIDRMKIQYVLHPGSKATADTFFFKIRDKGGNVLANQPFHLTWCWISFRASQYTVKETDGIFEVELQRRGYLEETSFITITATNRSAKVGEDTLHFYAPQVQFSPGQTEKTWRIHLRDDTKYERSEVFRLQLSDPVMAVLEQPYLTQVTINDDEDESVLYIPDREYRVAEDIGEIFIPIKRTGDLTDEFVVICTTVKVTAEGTSDHQILSGSDYISRPDDHRSIIRFDTMEKERLCRVTIIDDSLYEEEERFQVVLRHPMGGRLDNRNSTYIVIEPDKDDEPVFYFGHSEYSVDESGKQVDVMVLRTGTDLTKTSSVTIRSRMLDPRSAEAGLDYIAVNKILYFAPGVTMATVPVRILDDLGRPQLEGVESFQVVLSVPVGATLEEPTRATININDSLSDAPSMQFRETVYEVNEEDGIVATKIVRYGDISKESSVRCYTRQDSAQVMMDYTERPNTNASLITFLPGEREKDCIVNIVDDDVYEPEDEVFRLVLGSPHSATGGFASVGSNNVTTIHIKDKADKPIVKFAEKRYFINEPLFRVDMSILTIPVIRTGDVSASSRVEVFSKDGSAKAGRDYNGFHKELLFMPGETVRGVEVQILYDNLQEVSEVFTVHLKDKNLIQQVKKNARVQVYIEEKYKLADVVFPLQPTVVSLRDYDNIEDAEEKPVNGYPLICVTACNPRHPEFSKTSSVCKSQEINDTLTKFRWKVAPPTSGNGVTNPLRELKSTTFFAPTNGITLDSVYFTAGSRVQCFARAVNLAGKPGNEVRSYTVTVSTEDGICLPRVAQSVGSEPFSAKLRYLGPTDREHPNKVRVSVTVPHTDGLLPVISTYRPSNFEFILTAAALRVAQHQCTNLVDITDFQEQTTIGFLSNATRHSNAIGEMEPYQYSALLRSEPTLRFYRNLDLESCLWEYNGYFDMSELVSKCGGVIATDGQAINLRQSSVTLRVPLYVSYVSYSDAGSGGWKHVDTQTELQLSFVYNTAVLWQNGISSPKDSDLKGSLYPTSMRMLDSGRLAVTFTTLAKFRGMFLPYHISAPLQSNVTSPDHPELTFDLRLIRSDPTHNQPEQMWEFESKMAIKDYSGLYYIKLIPCTTSLQQEYSNPVQCNPGDLLTFELPIRFQQVSDPVPSAFTLDTNFQLMRNRALWLSEGSVAQGGTSDAAFAPGDKIYGKISVESVQSLGEEFQLNLEKVFLCTGEDGYIPKYDPANREYGCLAKTSNLQHVFKILDKGAPHTITESFSGVPFSATMAADDPAAVKLVKQPGADGFSVNVAPLFEVDSGRMWFLHVIYTIRSRRNKRDVANQVLITGADRWKRAIDDAEEVGKDGKGTNMVRIVMSDSPQKDQSTVDVYEVSKNDEEEKSSLIPTLVGIALLLVLTIIILAIFIRRRRKQSSPPPSPTSTMTVISGSGKVKVVQVNPGSDSDRTEV